MDVDAASGSLPEYLSSGSSLIKALKSQSDPPQPSWPSKVEIAQQAWKVEDFDVPRKAEVLRDWILEAWLRSKPGQSKASPLLEPEYYRLFAFVSPSCTTAPSIQLNLLSAFFQSIKHTSWSPGLLKAVRDSFKLLFPKDNTHKAEAWVEVWIELLEVVVASPVPSIKFYSDEPLGALVDAVTKRVMESLATSQNEKKIAQLLADALPVMSQAFRAKPSLHGSIVALTPYLFPESILHTVDYFKPILSTLSGQPDRLATLSFLPDLFAKSIIALRTYRFSLFSRGSGSSQSLEVTIAEKLRTAINANLGLFLGVISQIQEQLVNCTTSRDQTIASLKAVWKARSEVWSRVKAWGGYLETDDAAGRLLAAESAMAGSVLSVYGGSASTTDNKDNLATHLLSTLNTLEQLDHKRAEIGTDIIGWCLASPSHTSFEAQQLLASVHNYHKLTRSVGMFFTLLAQSIQAVLDPSLPDEVIITLYGLVRSGLVLSRPQLISAVEHLDPGNRRGPAWTAIVNELCDSASQLLVSTSSPGEKRKSQEEMTLRSATSIELLSLLLDPLLDAASLLRNGDDAAEAAVDRAASVLDTISFEKDPPTKKKRRTSDKGAASASTAPLDIALVAKLRLIRYARSVHRNREYDVDNVEVAKAMTDFSRWQDLRIELFMYAASYLSVDQSLALLVDPLLDVLGDNSAFEPIGPNSNSANLSLGEVAWAIILELGVVLFENSCNELQLDRLVSILVSTIKLEVESNVSPEENTPVDDVLESAQTWELPRFRAALFKYLENSVTSNPDGVFEVLIRCPVKKFPRKAFMDAAYELDKTVNISIRVTLRHWLAGLADEGILGPLVRTPAVIRQLVDVGDGEGSPSPHLVSATIYLLNSAFSHICTQIEHRDVLSYIVGDAITRSASIARNDLDLEGLPVQSVISLCDAIVQRPKKKYTADLLARFEELSNNVKALLEPAVVNKLDQGDIDALPLFEAWLTWARFARWLSPSSTLVSHGQRLLSLAIIQRPLPADLGLTVFKLVAVEAGPTETDLVVAAYIVVLAASHALWSGRTLFRTKLETAFASQLQKGSVEQFEGALRLAMDFAQKAKEERKVETALNAVQVMLATSLDGSGRAIARVIPDLLTALDHIILQGNVATMNACNLLLAKTVSSRAGLFRATDIHRIISILHASFAPAGDRLHLWTTNLDLLDHPISVLTTLTRHRPDLVVETLAPFVGLIAASVPLFQRPRNLRLTKASRDKIASRMPAWVGEADLVPPAITGDTASVSSPASIRRGITEKRLEEIAGLLARLLTNLGSARYTPSRRDSTTHELDAVAVSVAGPLAKHAPAILVAYARAASAPTLGLSTGVRRALESGMFALCDVVTAGGRAGSRGREGEGVGLPFGLGEGEGGGAEKEVWADLWKAWGKKRYTGQG